MIEGVGVYILGITLLIGVIIWIFYEVTRLKKQYYEIKDYVENNKKD